jgi:hypothetical protein
VLGRAAPAALVAVAALADLAHAGSFAFYVLVVAVPVAAAASLTAFGELVAVRADCAGEGATGVRSAFSTLALALTVFAGALHAQAVFGGPPARVAIPVVAAAFLTAAIAAVVRPARVAATGREARAEADELFEAA